MEPWENGFEMSDDSRSHLIIPKWFLTMSSIGLTLATVTFVPWVVWQTRVVMRLEVQMEVMASNSATMQANAAAVAALQMEAAKVASEMDRIKQDIKALLDDRWRRRDMRQLLEQWQRGDPTAKVPQLLE